MALGKLLTSLGVYILKNMQEGGLAAQMAATRLPQGQPPETGQGERGAVRMLSARREYGEPLLSDGSSDLLEMAQQSRFTPVVLVVYPA